MVSFSELDALAHEPDDWASITNRFAGHAVAAMREVGIPDNQIHAAIESFYGRTPHLDAMIDKWRFATQDT